MSSDVSSSSMRYFCHRCKRDVTIDQDLRCTTCGDGFVEELTMLDPSEFAHQFSLRLDNGPWMGAPDNESLLIDNFIHSIMAPRETQGQSATLDEGFENILRTLMHSLVANSVGGTGGYLGNNFSFHFGPDRTGVGEFFPLFGNPADYAWGPYGIDVIITQLLNQLEGVGPKPASEESISNLPDFTITQNDVDGQLQCAVCMENFQLEEITKRLPCKHCFHGDCIVPWLKLHGTCPVCRKTLDGEDTSRQEFVVPSQSASNASNTFVPGSAHEDDHRASSSSAFYDYMDLD